MWKSLVVRDDGTLHGGNGKNVSRGSIEKRDAEERELDSGCGQASYDDYIFENIGARFMHHRHASCVADFGDELAIHNAVIVLLSVQIVVLMRSPPPPPFIKLHILSRPW